VENLTLNRNLLETLPEHLLEMKLGIGFSAKSNRLSSVRVLHEFRISMYLWAVL
jgi:hypothetical protein